MARRPHTAKLIEKEVIEIKDLLIYTEFDMKEIAGMYGVNTQSISNIKCGYTWKNVGPDVSARKSLRQKYDMKHYGKLFLQNYSPDMTYKEMAQILGLTIEEVYYIRNWYFKNLKLLHNRYKKLDKRKRGKIKLYVRTFSLRKIAELFKVSKTTVWKVSKEENNTIT